MLLEQTFCLKQIIVKSEIQKHLAFTADYADSAVLADSTSYYYPALGITVSINADHVIFIFGYL